MPKTLLTLLKTNTKKEKFHSLPDELLWSLQANSKCTASTSQWEPRHLSYSLYKNQKGLGISFTLEQVLQVSRSLQFCVTRSLTHLWSLPLHFSFLIGLCSWKSGWWDTKDLGAQWWSYRDSETARRCGADSSCDFPVNFCLFSVLLWSFALFTLQPESRSYH